MSEYKIVLPLGLSSINVINTEEFAIFRTLFRAWSEVAFSVKRFSMNCFEVSFTPSTQWMDSEKDTKNTISFAALIGDEVGLSEGIKVLLKSFIDGQLTLTFYKED